MADRNSSFARVVLAGCALACVAALSAALLIQHVGGLQPCAWCVFQRGIYLLIAAVCAAGALVPGGPGVRATALVLADLLSAGGVAAALFHNFVAARPGGCGVTIADKFLMWSGLWETVPWMFNATAPCDEANAPLLGIPFALWSATLFAMLGVAAGAGLVQLLRAGARR